MSSVSTSRLPCLLLAAANLEKNRRGHAVYGFDTSLFSRSVKKTRKQKKKAENGHISGCLMFWSTVKEIEKNKRTKKHTVSKTHLWGSTCCPGSSGYSQSFFREMSLLCIFLQSVLNASNSHIDDFCQIDTGFVISRQEKSTPGMLKLEWGTGIETKSRLGE